MNNIVNQLYYNKNKLRKKEKKLNILNMYVFKIPNNS